jgi:hypothetical protein
VHDHLGSYRPAFATLAVAKPLALAALAGVRDERPAVA